MKCGKAVVGSGRKAMVFNIKKNDFRLITAVHYEKVVVDAKGALKTVEGKIHLFYFLTHAEYDEQFWKARL